MTRKTLGKDGLPLSAKNKIVQVGKNIKLARKRRGFSMRDMANRMFVTRKTISRLESGDPGISFGILVSALITLGLEKDLEKLANPENDITGNLMDKQRYDKKKRIRSPKPINMNF